MMRKGRMRRAVRWGGVALTVILPVVWGVSVFRGVGYVSVPGEWMIGFGRGAFRVVSEPALKGWPVSGWAMSGYNPANPRPMVWLPEYEGLSPGWITDIPMWMPWLPVACLTAWRFKVDRMKPVHACTSCGYDKTGLDAAAVCPECGAAARPSVVPGG